MKNLWLGLALVPSLWASSASAQNSMCSDRPTSDSSNACANTRFVHNSAGATRWIIPACVGSNDNGVIKAALATLPTTGSNIGGVVYIPPGISCAWDQTSEALTPPTNNVTILGYSEKDENTTLPSRLIFTGTGTGRGIDARDKRGFVINGLEITYTSATYSGNLIDFGAITPGATVTAFPAINNSRIGTSTDRTGTATLVNASGTVDLDLTNIYFYHGFPALKGQSILSQNVRTTLRRVTFTKSDAISINGCGESWVLDGVTFEPLADGTAGGVTNTAALYCKAMSMRGVWAGDVTVAGGTWFNLTSQGLDISGSQIAGDLGSATQGIVLNSSSGVSMAGNRFELLSTAINGATAGTTIEIGSNHFISVTNPIIYNGTAVLTGQFSAIANATAGYTTIKNGAQVSMGSPVPPSTMFGGNTVGLQQALVGTLSIAAGDATGYPGYAVVGYGESGSGGGNTGVVGVGGFARPTAAGTNASLWGSNVGVGNNYNSNPNTGLDVNWLSSVELNINIAKKAAGAEPTIGQAYGIYLIGSGDSTTNQGTGVSVNKLSIATNAKWNIAFESTAGAAVDGLRLNQTASSGSSLDSQPLTFKATGSGGSTLTASIKEDFGGNVLIHSSTGANVYIGDDVSNQIVSVPGGSGAKVQFPALNGGAAGVIHNDTSGNLSTGKVVSADMNITTSSCTNQFVTAISAGGVGTCTTATLASAQYANQGTTTTVLHGNAAGNPSWAAVSLSTDVTGTLQAAQEPAHTGDVTNTAGSLALTIAANAVTNAKMATMATNTVKGSATSGTAVPTDLAVGTCSTAASALIWTTNTGFGCNTSITAAAVPASGLTGTTLAAGVTASSLTSLGTIASLTATTINAHALGGTISGGGNQINNVVIGTTTPLAITGTTITANTSFTTANDSSGGIFFKASGGSADAQIFEGPGGTFNVKMGTSNTLNITKNDSTSVIDYGVTTASALTFTPNLLYWAGSTADTAATDASVCRRTSNGQLLTGTGALGVCVGTSSARYKHDIVDVNAGLADIMKLHPVNFRYNKGHIDDGKFLQYGFIAEEVVKTTPGLVRLDETKRPNSVDMLAMVPILVKAVQELKAANDNMRTEITALKAKGIKR